MSDELKFKVAPHIVQDLGLNLYTSLPRVLVEFVANAYDADSDVAKISLQYDAIQKARNALKQQFELDKTNELPDIIPLEQRVLPNHLSITISDHGHGMTREDLDEKFLVAGRRRLEVDDSNGRSQKGRPLMGRKGLGKLAGFGVAKLVEVMSRKEGETHTTKITLNYDDLLKHKITGEIPIPTEQLDELNGLDQAGTTIKLSHLLYSPTKSRAITIENELAEHFELIDPTDFLITINGTPANLAERILAYAWPEPDEDVSKFITDFFQREDGDESYFEYRMRFTGDKQALPAARRGVRVYVNKRLAASPSLLGADTNMHGFRMTDYLDGVVHADFIADEGVDYIATDRQALRWESPLLSPLYDFLSAKIKEACTKYQGFRDEKIKSNIRDDEFTKEIVTQASLNGKDRNLAFSIATKLASACKKGIQDEVYKSTLPPIVLAIGHGNILTAITEIASQEKPEFHEVAIQIAKLAKDEFDHFASTIKARIKALIALEKIVKATDFEKRENEGEIQGLLETSPWIIDPTYSQFLTTADKSFNVLFNSLSHLLNIDPKKDQDSNKRPDLVFLLGNASLGRIVVVELKSANTPLSSEHLDQLQSYMRRCKKWLQNNDFPHFSVYGQLIGTMGDPDSNARGQEALQARMEDEGVNSNWKVRSYSKVLDDAQNAHSDLLNVYNEIHEEDHSEDELEIVKTTD